MYKSKNKSYRRKAKGKPIMKRRFKKKNAIKSMILRGPKGMVFPDNYTCKLRYNHLRVLSGSPSTYLQFRANSCFDPDFAIGGGQPMGYDQLSAMYLKYRVNACKIKLTVTNLQNVPVYVIIYPLTSSSVPAGLNNDIEQRYSKFKIVSGITSNATGVLTSYIDMNKLFGEKELDDVYEASTGANPNVTGYWNVSFYSVDATTNLNIPISAELTYYVTFKDPVRLANS